MQYIGIAKDKNAAEKMFSEIDALAVADVRCELASTAEKVAVPASAGNQEVMVVGIRGRCAEETAENIRTALQYKAQIRAELENELLGSGSDDDDLDE